MLRGPFPGHRRYSITHRAVQRLRELVPTMDDLDDEALRDQLDVALGKAEDGGKAVRTLDAMLGEPQVLIPVEDFGETLVAISGKDSSYSIGRREWVVAVEDAWPHQGCRPTQPITMTFRSASQSK
ncbi:hypothetical protein [Enhygromyxa salina]|uniref:Uncharacterized protein n=1 Tax=Enhygromyxa salina TaxID=215803 RepID=A0A2S9Y619_9BACT|nr:hypothetical protein [Enhygromyxa salina]PRQ00532.1 hypothetical protein ENSA7_60260 [Enhygromyxa salina]